MNNTPMMTEIAKDEFLDNVNALPPSLRLGFSGGPGASLGSEPYELRRCAITEKMDYSYTVGVVLKDANGKSQFFRHDEPLTINEFKALCDRIMPGIGVCDMETRSAFGCIATFCADQHPLIGVDEEGIKIMQNFIYCSRRGSGEMISDVYLAYVSKHAIGRLHEREIDLTSTGATGVLAFIAILGYLTRNSQKHIMDELCLHFGNTLIVGSLKRAAKHMNNGREINGTFYDVRTALPPDEVKAKEMLDRGRIASDVVARWFANPLNDDDTLANRIPLLPRRADDYTLRSAAVTH